MMDVDIEFSNVPDRIQKYLDDSLQAISKNAMSTAYHLGCIRGYLDCELDTKEITSDTYVFLINKISEILQPEIFKISEKTC